ncbi:AAA domain-containing protein, partial [Neocallimastix sp. 'constans']
LREANVIVCTLCSSGNRCIENLGFGFLIIDEACQATELTTLIPFTYNIPQIVLIGDPKQLPPTVKSGKLQKCNYGRSLFERIYKRSKSELTLLNVQYRMHPDISRLANKAFYDNKIFDGENVKSKEWIGEWCKNNKKFGPLVFYDVKGNTTQNNNSSISNEEEAQLVINCINELLHSYSNICFSKRISIITFYNAQVSLIKKKLREYYEDTFKELLKKANIFKNIQVNTVDSYQGQENDIVILSTVRSDGKIGFLRNANRVNVSLTRARNSLIIIGNVKTLCTNGHWNKIIKDILLNGSFKLDGEQYFNTPHSFPKNILPKDFFEDLKKTIEQEKQEKQEKLEKHKKLIMQKEYSTFDMFQEIDEIYQINSIFSKMRINNF